MKPILHALPWAIAMLLVATGERLGYIQSNVAGTMMVVLPALMIATMGRTCRCLPKRAD